jgi:hypothetical protein
VTGAYRRRNLLLGPISGIHTPATREPADRPQGHVVVAHYLTAKSKTWVSQEPFGGQYTLLCLGHLLWFSVKELHSTGRTAGVPAAGVWMVYGRHLHRVTESFKRSFQTSWGNPKRPSTSAETLRRPERRGAIAPTRYFSGDGGELPPVDNRSRLPPLGA